jgi:UDP-N-acetylmuramate--alanine ligase
MSEHAYAHFIGIGGAGMSGIALVLNARGLTVTGSDVKASRYTRALERVGVEVAIGHDAANLGDPDVVVVSSAIPETNPELAEARSRGIPVWQRAQMLAHLAEDRVTVAVAGTHGKTTTSSMVATMLAGMGLEPTFLIGGEVTAFGTNAVTGSGPHYVVEADESDGSFMHLDPAVLVITNVEADHLDHYGTLERVEETFVEFMAKLPPDGVIIACKDDERLMELVRTAPCAVVTYGRDLSADVSCRRERREGIGYRFEVQCTPKGAPDEGGEHATVELTTASPGMHNVSNATAAIAVAHALGLDLFAAASALSGFHGVHRRFEEVGVVDGITVVADYAHHPTEVAATLDAAGDLGFNRVWAIFQPHRYSRTSLLAEEFGVAFDSADRLVLLDVYSAGETPIPGVSGRTIMDSVLRHSPRTPLAWLPHRADVVPYLRPRLEAGDLVLTLGAGDVTTLGPDLVKALEAEAN